MQGNGRAQDSDLHGKKPVSKKKEGETCVAKLSMTGFALVKGARQASVPPRPGQIHLWMETFRFSDLAFCRTAGMTLSAAL